MAAEDQMEAHEEAMVTHIAQHAMAATLAAGATNEEAIAAGHAVMETTTGASSAHMQD